MLPKYYIRCGSSPIDMLRMGCVCKIFIYKFDGYSIFSPEIIQIKRTERNIACRSETIRECEIFPFCA